MSGLDLDRLNPTGDPSVGKAARAIIALLRTYPPDKWDWRDKRLARIVDVPLTLTTEGYWRGGLAVEQASVDGRRIVAIYRDQDWQGGEDPFEHAEAIYTLRERESGL